MNATQPHIEVHYERLLLLYKYFRADVALSYQSWTLDFGEWIPLLTLCFAPLIAHIITGVPWTTRFSHSQPRWHDVLPLYHPVTIVWRYLITADRRLRATSWDVADLAAVNTFFWTPDGWDGGEEIAVRTRKYLTRPPEPGKMRTMTSAATVGTIITTLQGIEAIYILVAQNYGIQSENSIGFTLANLFTNISILGLLRLPAAAWITGDFAYTHGGTFDMADDTSSTTHSQPFAQPDEIQKWQPIASSDDVSAEVSRYKTLDWKNYLLRFVVVAAITVLAVYTILCSFVWPSQAVPHASATSSDLLANFLYFFLVTPASIFFLMYGFRRDAKSLHIILPCVKTWWYKTYTLLWFLFALVVLIIAGLETRKDKCGEWTNMIYDIPGEC